MAGRTKSISSLPRPVVPPVVPPAVGVASTPPIKPPKLRPAELGIQAEFATTTTNFNLGPSAVDLGGRFRGIARWSVTELLTSTVFAELNTGFRNLERDSSITKKTDLESAGFETRPSGLSEVQKATLHENRYAAFKTLLEWNLSHRPAPWIAWGPRIGTQFNANLVSQTYVPETPSTPSSIPNDVFSSPNLSVKPADPISLEKTKFDTTLRVGLSVELFPFKNFKLLSWLSIGPDLFLEAPLTGGSPNFVYRLDLRGKWRVVENDRHRLDLTVHARLPNCVTNLISSETTCGAQVFAGLQYFLQLPGSKK